MTDCTHLVRVNIEPRALYRFAKRTGLPMREVDEGYVVHATFAATFDHRAAPDQRRAPRPFRIINSSSQSIQVLAYSSSDHEQLRARAATQDARVAGVVDLESLSSRPVPQFEAGCQMAFEVQACPVRRVAKRGKQRDERAEVDVYLAHVWQEEDADARKDRISIYRDWLRADVEKDGAAKVLSVDVASFRLGRQFRRTQGPQRKSAATRHPDVRFHGVLEVRDATAFAFRLARGVGRHRTFGFGMLLLRPKRGGDYWG